MRYAAIKKDLNKLELQTPEERRKNRYMCEKQISATEQDTKQTNVANSAAVAFFLGLSSNSKWNSSNVSDIHVLYVGTFIR